MTAHPTPPSARQVAIDRAISEKKNETIRTLRAEVERLTALNETLQKTVVAAELASVKCTQTEDGECCYRKARRWIGCPRDSVGQTGSDALAAVRPQEKQM